MAKKGFDPIADAHELAEHNMNSYYWVNKVNSYTYARWMTGKKLAPLLLPFYLIFWVPLYLAITHAAGARGVGVWDFLLNINDIQALSYLAFSLILGFVTVVTLIMVVQLILVPRPKPNESIPKREKKKKMPRHRKDYH